MKFRICLILTVCVILLNAVFGLMKQQRYTNIVGDDNYLEQLQVAAFPEEFAIDSCNKLSQNLPYSTIILRVSVLGDMEHLFGVSRQKVRINKIYVGNGLEIEQEIYLFSNHWSLSLNNNPNSIERGFVNIMKVGSEYLVFVSQRVKTLNENVPVYQLYDDSLITPIFCYEDQANSIVLTEGESTYVSYS